MQSQQKHAVLTVAQAARALHMREADARDWLESQGLVLCCAGRRRVIWADVLRTLRQSSQPGEGVEAQSNG